MKFLSKTLLLLVAAFSISSCDLSSDSESTCLFYEGAAAVAVTGPETATVNQEITLTVSYTSRKDCGTFQNFYEVADVNNVNSLTITVNTRVESCNCSTATVTKTEPYKFKALSAGTYILKFKKSNEPTDVITKTIVVE